MYVELHTHSYFSLLDGVPTPEALVAKAARFGMPALALTDHDALYGAARFAVAAEQAGIKPIFGAELTLVNGSTELAEVGGGHLTLLAENDAGYANLCRLITLARRDQEKGMAALPWRRLANHAKGIIALSGCRRGEVARALLERDAEKALRSAERFASIFGRGNFFLEMQRHHERGDRRLNAGLVALAHRLKLPLATTGNVHYLTRDDAHLHDVLTCIRHRAPLANANGLLRPNAEYCFRAPAEMAHLFSPWPQALRATLEIAERCNAQLPRGPQALPPVTTADGRRPTAVGGQWPVPSTAEGSAGARLRHLCEMGLARKVAAAPPEYRAALKRELAIIEEQGLANYFLIVWDLVRFARGQGTRSACQGRGSAANSLVAYLLDITPIDPLSVGLVFERFLSRERAAPPDIDLDFAADRREEVIQYLYQKYGHDHAAMACTVVTFRERQALRDVGMLLGLKPEEIEKVVGESGPHQPPRPPCLSRRRERQGGSRGEGEGLLSLAAALEGFPRHLGIHNGGMVLTRAPLSAQLPVEPATMEGRTVVQWDKDSLELAGWIKLDVLSLRTLAAIEDACDIVAQQTGARPDLNALAFDDPAVYDMICRGETIGCFQVESRAQASLIPRFQPRNFADITVQIALIRPGPVQANMVHPYLRRRDGIEPVTYLHPALESALGGSLGIVLFQEDVLKVARDLAGFTPGEGELLRRALGHKRAGEQIEAFHARFIAGARARGVPEGIAAQVFEQLMAFGGYSFSKAHAAAFAVITYWSAWLRCHHPTAFFAGVLRHQPMGFYPKHVVVADGQRVGVKFLPVDLRYSEAKVTVEADSIRLGFEYVHGFGEDRPGAGPSAAAELLLDERRRRPFTSLRDLAARTELDRRRVEALVLAGALDHLGERRQLLWDVAEAFHLARRPRAREAPELPLRIPDEQVDMPPMDADARLATTFATTGVSIEGHLSSLRRDVFTRAGAKSIGELPQLKHNQRVRIGGVIVTRQRPPTAKGVCFLALEDTDGIVNVVVPPPVYAECAHATRAMFAVIDGVVQHDHGAINVLARKVTAV